MTSRAANKRTLEQEGASIRMQMAFTFQYTVRLCGAAIVSCGLAFAQSAATPLVFDSAEVRLSPPGRNQSMSVVLSPEGRYELWSATMLDLIETAWGLHGDSVYGGPSWLDLDRFDVVTKTSPGSTADQRARMLRALLAERFRLATHNDEKPLDVFALTVDRQGQKLQPADGSRESGCRQTGGEQGPPIYILVTCTHATMAGLAQQLPELAGVAYLGHQVVDLTGLQGGWNFTLKWTPRARLVTPAPAGSDAEPIRGILLFDAVRVQLGLKLEMQKRMMPVLVVDSADRTPSGNPPAAAKTPAATAFEVAEIKPSQPGSPIREAVRLLPGGRVELRSMSLKSMIGMAWELSPAMIAGGPKWVESDLFDVVAKASTKTSDPDLSIDEIRIMLRTLIGEQFKLSVHKEDLSATVFLLTVGRKGPLLKEADPASRTGCKYTFGELGGGAAPVPLFTQTCQNLTMAQLAERLPGFAPGYVDRPAVDMTGLKGSYDFAVSWVTKGRALGTAAQGAGNGEASNPSEGHTIFESLDKLGLKLEAGKHPMPGLVIDHAETLGSDK